MFNGANIAEEINISANGGRVTFTRNVAAVVMDNNDVEHITFNALGGADNILINDLSGTDVTEVNVNLAGDRRCRRCGGRSRDARMPPAATM